MTVTEVGGVRLQVSLAYEGVTKSLRTGHLEREIQMVQLSATRCSCVAILWVSLVSFAAITLCVASQRVFIAVVYFIIDSVRKLLDTPSYTKVVSQAGRGDRNEQDLERGCESDNLDVTAANRSLNRCGTLPTHIGPVPTRSWTMRSFSLAVLHESRLNKNTQLCAYCMQQRHKGHQKPSTHHVL
jgi:hypothetical protein